METLTDILNKLLEFLGFIFNSLVNLLDFISVYILDLPVVLFTMFSELPEFMQTGISIILGTIVLLFVMKIIKHVRETVVS